MIAGLEIPAVQGSFPAFPCKNTSRACCSCGHWATVSPRAGLEPQWQWPLEAMGLRHRESAFSSAGILQLLLGSQDTQQQQQQLFLHKQGCFFPHRLCVDFLGPPP